MKIAFIGFAILLVSPELAAQSTLTKVQWLLGEWSRTNAKPGRSGIETWKKISDTEFIGTGVNLRGLDTAFVEELKIISRENKIFYVADIPENREPTLFEATSLSRNAITFENPHHDFPKKIIYELNGSKLKATVSGEGKSIDYWFEKKH